MNTQHVYQGLAALALFLGCVLGVLAVLAAGAGLSALCRWLRRRNGRVDRALGCVAEPVAYPGKLLLTLLALLTWGGVFWWLAGELLK